MSVACACGCGQPVGLATKTNAREGRIAGQPTKYLNGHSSRYSPTDRWTEDANGCWIWNLTVHPISGYGCSGSFGRSTPAHRAVWERTYNIRLPWELHLDHLCRIRLCVNPDHLEVVTAAENQRRSPNAKLTFAKAEAIRASTEQHKVLALRYGVSRSTIGEIKRGTKWRPDDTTLVDQINALVAERKASA